MTIAATRHYYNEFDPYAAQWLRNLISAGHLPDGDVDTRSITDVKPDDLDGYVQCHFFAGIGGWPLALRLAGWPEDREVWTGSPPCQPFSVAGKQRGTDDSRHLWPHYLRLIAARRPLVVMGEQVAAAIGQGWFDGVRADLSREGYTCRGAVLPGCAIDAPHRRDRLWFVADTIGARLAQRIGDAGVSREMGGKPEGQDATDDAGAVVDADGEFARRHAGAVSGEEGSAERCVRGVVDGLADAGRGRDMAHTDGADAERGTGPGAGSSEAGRARAHDQPAGPGGAVPRHADGCGDVADADVAGAGEGREQRGGQFGGAGGNPSACAGHVADAVHQRREARERAHDAPRLQCDEIDAAGARRGAWSGAAWIIGHDGKARRVEPGIRLLAHGVPARVGKLRAYGNAIVPQVAAEVIAAYLECQK